MYDKDSVKDLATKMMVNYMTIKIDTYHHKSIPTILCSGLDIEVSKVQFNDMQNIHPDGPYTVTPIVVVARIIWGVNSAFRSCEDPTTTW